MPGLYMEDEAFYDEEYENAFENAYDSGEVSYDQGDEAGNASDDGYEDSGDAQEVDWMEEEQTIQDESEDDRAWADIENPDAYDETDDFVAEDSNPPSTDDVEITEDDDEITANSSYTYDDVRMETSVPVVTDLLGNVTFRVDYNANAEIPDGSSLHAEEIDTWAETEEERAYKAWRLASLENEAEALLAESDSDWS